MITTCKNHNSNKFNKTLKFDLHNESKSSVLNVNSRNCSQDMVYVLIERGILTRKRRCACQAIHGAGKKNRSQSDQIEKNENYGNGLIRCHRHNYQGKHI